MAKQSWRLSLIEYLATPLDSNTPSPSELNGHRFNSFLPNVSTFSSSKHSDVLVSHHDAQLQCDKRDHVLPELSVGSKVGYRDYVTNKLNVGIVSAKDARSYTIFTESGALISSYCIDLKCTDVLFDFKTSPVVSSNAKSMHAPPSNLTKASNVKHSSKTKLTEKGVGVRKSNSTNNVYKICSGHVSKPVTRLITQM